jgi:hypothetical protein
MYLVVCNEPFHGNKVGYVTNSLLEARHCITQCCVDFDFDIPEFRLGKMIDRIVDHKYGHINDDSKIELEVSITEIKIGKKLDLE